MRGSDCPVSERSLILEAQLRASPVNHSSPGAPTANVAQRITSISDSRTARSTQDRSPFPFSSTQISASFSWACIVRKIYRLSCVSSLQIPPPPQGFLPGQTQRRVAGNRPSPVRPPIQRRRRGIIVEPASEMNQAPSGAASSVYFTVAADVSRPQSLKDERTDVRCYKMILMISLLPPSPPAAARQGRSLEFSNINFLQRCQP